ncbi:succinoglycan biosynthesis protein ExoO [Loktanella ponticola]|uniref:Succinoglycan biosynthesis protein ExoO n=1 Tax=Yoonia ponticola TaxID=1524255 RepID=A0A7W9EX50_9RHOB|nr:glycosyltransferase family 2 protein [Yoonia ponticola]MBB5721269.1 succinoglycan biosynthesis protein ExoO [Yoonia ponticola]
MTAQPSVSVIIAAYNAAPFIHRAVASALAQTDVALEILVVDDASSDDTLEVLERLAQSDTRIKTIMAPANKGPAAARNLALAQVTSDWIAVLDSDDSFQPNRLRRMIDIAKRQNADIVLDDFQSVLENGDVVPDAALSSCKSAGLISAVDWVALNAFARSQVSFGYAKPVMSTQFVRQKGLHYNETLRNGEDYHLILNALLNAASVYFTAQIGYNYTRRHGSVSHKANDAHLRALQIADDQVASTTDQITLRKWMNIRRENLRDLQTTETFLRNLKSSRLDQSMMALLKRPRAAGRVALHLSEAIAKRFGRNR